MICVSLAELSPEECRALLKTLDFAEIRMDTMAMDGEDIRKLFSSHPRLIATFRPGKASMVERREKLIGAVTAGAAYVDIELDADQDFRSEIISEARSRGCRVILSHHDFEGTPQRDGLEAIVESCFAAGADIAKIACMAHAPRDSARLLGLLDDPRPIVVIGMGEHGRMTRPASLLAGSPFTYASPVGGKTTAPGQWDIKQLKSLLRRMTNV
jgi:3-dehydroquinate dehydratase-1